MDLKIRQMYINYIELGINTVIDNLIRTDTEFIRDFKDVVVVE